MSWGAVAAKAEDNKVSKYCHLDAVISLCQWRWKHAVLSGLKWGSFQGAGATGEEGYF